MPMPQLTEEDRKAVIEARLGKALLMVIGQGVPDGPVATEMLDALKKNGLKLSIAPIPKVEGQ